MFSLPSVEREKRISFSRRAFSNRRRVENEKSRGKINGTEEKKSFAEMRFVFLSSSLGSRILCIKTARESIEVGPLREKSIFRNVSLLHSRDYPHKFAKRVHRISPRKAKVFLVLLHIGSCDFLSSHSCS